MIQQMLLSGQQYGGDIVANGTFSSDTDWTKGVGWTISGGKAHCSGAGSLTQSLSLQESADWEVTYTISGFSGTGVYVRLTSLDTSTDDGALRSASGTYTEIISASSLNKIAFNPSTGSETFDLDNVIVRRKFF